MKLEAIAIKTTCMTSIDVKLICSYFSIEAEKRKRSLNYLLSREVSIQVKSVFLDHPSGLALL